MSYNNHLMPVRLPIDFLVADCWFAILSHPSVQCTLYFNLRS